MRQVQLPLRRWGIVVLLLLSTMAPMVEVMAAPGPGSQPGPGSTDRILPIANRQDGDIAPLAAAPPTAEIIPDQYVVVLNDSAAGFSAASVAEEMTSFAAADTDSAATIHVTQTYDDALLGFSANIPAAGMDTVRQDPRVAWVEPVRKYVPHIYNLASNNVARIGATVNSTAKIDGVNNSLNVDVAVIDTGVSAEPSINLASSWYCTDINYSGDVDRHGTHVAGIIGARDLDIGVVGVAPGARIHSMRVYEPDGPDADTVVEGRSDWLICAMQWLATRHGGIPVANMSLGGDMGFTVEDNNCGRNVLDSFHLAICNAVNSGVTIVVSAGNDCADAKTYSPAGYKEVITVSAFSDTNGDKSGNGVTGGLQYWCDGFARIQYDETFAPFSNWGSVVDLAAPGVDIFSTVPGGFNYLSGTSMAAPHVAGAAALIIAKRGLIGPAAVRSALLSSREKTYLYLDPDGITEGIVNVRDGSVAVPTNDSRGAPVSITTLPYTAKVNLRGATQAESDPFDLAADDDGCVQNIGHNVWYRFTPTTTASYVLTSDSVDRYTGIAVFLKSGSSLSFVGCNVQPFERPSKVELTVSLTKGKTYDIMLGVGENFFAYSPFGGPTTLGIALQTNTPKLTFGRSSGTVGATVQYSVTGITKSTATIDWYNGSTKIRLGTFNSSNPYDTFIASSFTVPAAARGSHKVEFADAKGLKVSSTFTVVPKSTLSATSGRRSSQVVATLSGFKGKTPVEIRFYTGSSFVVLRTVTTSSLGGVTPAITIPSSATIATHKIVAIEKGGTFKAEADFKVTSSSPSASEVEATATATATATKSTATATTTAIATATALATAPATATSVPAWDRIEDGFDAGAIAPAWTTTGNVALTTVDGRGGVVVLSPRGSPANLQRAFAVEQQDLYAGVTFNAQELDRRGAPLLELTSSTGNSVVAVSLDNRGRIVVTDVAGKKNVKSRLRVDAGEWHTLELHATSGNSAGVEVWLDGVRVPELSTSMPGITGSLNGIRVGTVSKDRSFVLLLDNLAVDVNALGEHTVAQPTATAAPTEEAGTIPTVAPTMDTEAPTEQPSTEPTVEATATDEAEPTSEATASPEPTSEPTEASGDGAASNEQGGSDSSETTDDSSQRRSHCANDEDSSQRETRACR